MADTQTKILDIKVNYEEALKRVVEYKQNIEELRKEQARLRQEQAEDEENSTKNAHAIEELNSKIAVYKDGVQKLSKVMQNQVRQEEAQKGSLVQLRAELSNLTAEYDSLSRAEREGAKGQTLKNRINDITTALKAEEEATQRFYRNVGNYENAVRSALTNLNSELTEAQRRYAQLVAEEGEASKAAQEAKKHMEGLQYTLNFTEEATKGMNNALYSFLPFGKQIQALLPMIGTGAKGVGQAFKLAGQGAQILGKQLLALMANPIVAFLGVLAATIALVVKGIKGSEENMNQWQRVIAPLQRALSVLQNVLTTLCGWILNAVEFAERGLMALMKFAEAATSIFPSVQKAIKGVNEEVENSIRLAEREAQLAKDKRTNLVEEAKAEQKIAELRAKVNDKENYTAEQRLAFNKQAMEMEKELAEERKRIAEEEFYIANERAKWTDNDAKTNDDLAQKEAAMYKAQTDYLNKTREFLMKNARLNKEIAAERKAQHEEYKKQCEERARIAKETSDKEIQAIRALEDAMLALVEEGAEKRKKQINIQYDREIEALQKRLDEEKNLTAKAKDAITRTIIAKEEQRLQALNAVDQEINDKEIERQEKLMQLRLESAQKGSDAEYELKLQQMWRQRDAELAEVENDEEMKLAIKDKYIALQNELEDQRVEYLKKSYQESEKEAKKNADNESAIAKAKASAISSCLGSIAEAIEEVAGENKEAARLAKVLGLAEIYINQAVAISEAVRKNASEGDPYTMAARIAASVATIVASTIGAFASMNKAKFAKGGKVRGSGTGTSDSIDAKLSNGEFVMTAKATKNFEPLLEAMNAVSASPSVVSPSAYTSPVPATQNMEQGNALTEAIREIHPVVSVVDINEGQNRVKTIQNLDSL